MYLYLLLVNPSFDQFFIRIPPQGKRSLVLLTGVEAPSIIKQSNLIVISESLIHFHVSKNRNRYNNQILLDLNDRKINFSNTYFVIFPQVFPCQRIKNCSDCDWAVCIHLSRSLLRTHFHTFPYKIKSFRNIAPIAPIGIPTSHSSPISILCAFF